MAIFDQHGQNVNYQYNAAGDINIGSVQNQTQLINQIESLKGEISKATEAQVIDVETSTDVQYQITKAIQEAEKTEPNKKGVIGRLNNAKSILEGVTAASGILTALNKVIQLAVGLF